MPDEPCFGLGSIANTALQLPSESGRNARQKMRASSSHSTWNLLSMRVEPKPMGSTRSLPVPQCWVRRYCLSSVVRRDCHKRPGVPSVSYETRESSANKRRRQAADRRTGISHNRWFIPTHSDRFRDCFSLWGFSRRQHIPSVDASLIPQETRHPRKQRIRSHIVRPACREKRRRPQCPPAGPVA